MKITRCNFSEMEIKNKITHFIRTGISCLKITIRIKRNTPLSLIEE